MVKYTEFGAETRKIMLLKGMSMTDLSQRLGISNSYLSDIFKGNRDGGKYIQEIKKATENFLG